MSAASPHHPFIPQQHYEENRYSKDQMEWRAVYLDSKYYISDPISIKKLMTLAEQIEMQKRNAIEFRMPNNDKAANSRVQSIKSDALQFGNTGKAFDCKTEVDAKIQSCKKQVIEKELEIQQQKIKKPNQKKIEYKSKPSANTKNHVRISQTKVKEKEDIRQSIHSKKDKSQSKKEKKFIEQSAYITPQFQTIQSSNRKIEKSEANQKSDTKPLIKKQQEQESILNLESEQQKQLSPKNNSKQKIYEELTDKVQKLQQKIHQIEQKQNHEIEEGFLKKKVDDQIVRESQAIPTSKKDDQKHQINRKSRLNIAPSILTYKIIKQQQKLSEDEIKQQQKKKLSEQLNALRMTIRELKLQKIKNQAQEQVKRELQDLQQIPSQYTPSQTLTPRKEQFRSKRAFQGSILRHPTNQSIDSRVINQDSRRSSMRQRTQFGKIVRNSSPQKQESSVEYLVERKDHKNIASNEENIKTIDDQKTVDKNMKDSQIKSQTISFEPITSDVKQMNQTIEFKRGSEIHESTQSLLPVPLKKKDNRSIPPKFIIQRQETQANSKAFQIHKSKQIRSKLLNKFDKNEQRFSNFAKNEEEKAKKNRYSNEKTLRSSQMKTIDNPQLNSRTLELSNPRKTSNFLHLQGLIVKNNIALIQRQSSDSQSIKHTPAGRLIPKANQLDFQQASPKDAGRKIFELQFEKKMNRQVQFWSDDQEQAQIPIPRIEFPINQFIVPLVPEPPKVNTTLQEMVELVKHICLIFSLKFDQGDLYKLVLKKYKNCVMFTLPRTHTRIIWHFSGKLYIGDWQQQTSEKSGEGIQYIKDKYYYKGQFLENKKHGSGTQVFLNGNIYVGQFQNGEKHGRGKFFQKQSNIWYDGEWKDSKKQGYGSMKFGQKEFYVGTFSKNNKHGFGLQVFSNGDKYKGQYSHGQFHGKGKYIWANGSAYEGRFDHGLRNGHGKWKDGSGQSYVGQYSQDKKQGNGKYVWANGCVYQGSFHNDLKHGFGQVRYPDGRQMEGKWDEGTLIEVIGKMNEVHHQQPLQIKVNHPIQATTLIKIIETPSKELRTSGRIGRV